MDSFPNWRFPGIGIGSNLQYNNFPLRRSDSFRKTILVIEMECDYCKGKGFYRAVIDINLNFLRITTIEPPEGTQIIEVLCGKCNGTGK